jgi:hypothetical protein
LHFQACFAPGRDGSGDLAAASADERCTLTPAHAERAETRSPVKSLCQKMPTGWTKAPIFIICVTCVRFQDAASDVASTARNWPV